MKRLLLTLAVLCLATAASAQTTTRVLAQALRGPGTFTSSSLVVPANTQQVNLAAVMTTAQRDNGANCFFLTIERFDTGLAAWIASSGPNRVCCGQRTKGGVGRPPTIGVTATAG